jgi:hypothetical protein
VAPIFDGINAWEGAILTDTFNDSQPNTPTPIPAFETTVRAAYRLTADQYIRQKHGIGQSEIDECIKPIFNNMKAVYEAIPGLINSIKNVLESPSFGTTRLASAAARELETNPFFSLADTAFSLGKTTAFIERLAEWDKPKPFENQLYDAKVFDAWWEQNSHSPQAAPMQKTQLPAQKGVEKKEQRQDRRLNACEAFGLVMPNSYAGRLPDGIGKVAAMEGVERQPFSRDVKAAIERRNRLIKEGK